MVENQTDNVKNVEINEAGKDIPSTDTSKEYLAAIKELKANSVSRADYDKLKSENKQLLDSIVNGTQSIEVDTSMKKDPKEVIKELRSDLYVTGTDNMSNLEYVTKTLKLREELIKEGKPDPFEAGNAGVSSPKDYVNGGEVAERLQEMVDASDGDPIRFNAEYKRNIEPIKHFPSK